MNTLVVIWSLIDANISDELHECQKTTSKAYLVSEKTLPVMYAILPTSSTDGDIVPLPWL